MIDVNIADKRFTIRERGGAEVVVGLVNIPIHHSLLLLLVPDSPLADLKVGEWTIGKRWKETYEIVRVV